MVRRVVALVAILVMVVAGAWFFLRTTKPKEAQRLREKIEQLVSSENPSDWRRVTTEEERSGRDLNRFLDRLELARKASDAILAIYAHSRDDLMMRGYLEEVAGNLSEALRRYQQVLALKSPPPQVNLHRARLLQSLGMYTPAKQALLSVVDIYPYEVSAALGRLSLETFEAREAYVHWKRARALAGTDREVRESLGGIADALTLLFALNRPFGERAHQKTPGKAASPIECSVQDWKRERDLATEEAVALWKKLQADTGDGIVSTQLRIADLLAALKNPERIEEAIATLAAAVKNDKEHRYGPIYLRLGKLCLQLARERGTSPLRRDALLGDADRFFLDALSFEIEGGPKEIARATGWEVRFPLSRDGFRAWALVCVCYAVVDQEQGWRILSDRSESGERDALKIQFRVAAALESPRVPESLRLELRALRAFARLRAGRLPEFRTDVDGLLSSLREGERSELALRLAAGSAAAAPEQLDLLLDLLENHVLAAGEGVAAGDEVCFRRHLKAVQILHQARGYRLEEQERGRETGGETREGLHAEVQLVTGKIREILSRVARKAESPGLALAASRWMTSLVGPEEGLVALQESRKRFPEDENIRYFLGLAHLDKALSLDGRPAAVPPEHPQPERWDHYRAALGEFLHLFRQYPYREDIQRELLRIGSRFRNAATAPPMELAGTAAELFPQCSPEDKQVLASALEAFLNQDFEAAVRLAPRPQAAKGVRPFLNYLLGVSCLLAADSSGVEHREDLIAKAQREFEAGALVDPNYVPVRLGLILHDLTSVPVGERVPDELVEGIRKLVDLDPVNPQPQYFLAMALDRNRELLSTRGEASRTVRRILEEERNALRRAIESNPQFVKAYLALAGTYVAGWKPAADAPVPSMSAPSGDLKLDFKRAITILEFAPPAPEVQYQLAVYYRAAGELEKSLECFKNLFQAETTQANLQRVIGGYCALKDFTGARKWLAALDFSVLPNNDPEVVRCAILAEIAAGEAAQPELTRFERERLEEERIQFYRTIIGLSQRRRSEPPPFAVNNLAYTLAERGRPADVREALALIEPLVKRLRGEPQGPPRGSLEEVEETYAWVLYKNGRLEEAEEMYRRLCRQFRKGVFLARHAMVLYDLTRYEEAREQVQEARKLTLAPAFEKEARRLEGQIEIELQKRFERRMRIHE